jgi:hypothetical protein
MRRIMESSEKTKKLTIMVLTTIAVSVVIITGLYFYINRFIDSGFFFIRLARYMSLEGQSHIDVEQWTTFPFVPFLISSIQKITGLSTLNVVYLPYLCIIPLLYSYFFTRYFVSDKRFAIILALAIFLMALGTNAHFLEYQMGYLLFPVFAVLSLRYIYSRDYRYLILLIILLITMKFYYPYEEIFSVTFLVSLVIILYLLRKMRKVSDIFKTKGNIKFPYAFALFSLILLISYQPKGETLLHGLNVGFYKLDPFITIRNFFYGLITGSDLILEYGISTRAPFIPFLINTSLTLILSILILFVFLSFIFIIVKNRYYDKINIIDISLFLLMFAYIPYSIAKTAIGGLRLLTPIYIIGPIFIYYFLKRNRTLANEKGLNNKYKNRFFKYNFKKSLNKVPQLFAVVIIILVLSHHVSIIMSETHRPVGSDEINSSLVTHLDSNFIGKKRVLTDIDTFGVALTYLSQSGYDFSNMSQVIYTDERYSYIIGKGNKNESINIDIILVNEINIERPMQRGHPDWAYFKPLSNYETNIKKNANINQIYSSNGYTIYIPNI